MRPIVLCAALLVAVLVLYLLGREGTRADRPNALMPAEIEVERVPAEVEQALAAPEPIQSTGARSGARVDEALWQRLPTDEARADRPDGCVVRGRVIDSRSRQGVPGARLVLLARGKDDLELVKWLAEGDGAFELRVSRNRRESWAQQFERSEAERELRNYEQKLLAMQKAGASAEEIAEAARPLRYERSRGRAPRLSIVLEVYAQDYIEKEISLPINPFADAVHEIGDVLLDPGQMFGGRVLGTLDTGVPNVEVYLVSVDDLRRMGGTRTDARGEYLLGLPLPGRYHVHARAYGQGAAVLTDVELPPFGAPVITDVILRGSGMLSGQVVYPDGNAAEAVSVLAVPAEFAGGDLSAVPPERLVDEESQGGLFGSLAISSQYGDYEIPHLLINPYVLSFGDDLEHSTGPPVHPSASLKLVYPHARLRVEVKTPTGEDEWPPCEVQCIEVIERSDGTTQRRGLAPPLESPSTGDAFFRVEQGNRYELSARRTGRRIDPEAVTASVTEYETHVILVSRAEEEETRAAAGAGGSRDASAARDETRRKLPGVDRHEFGIGLVLDWAYLPARTPLPVIEAAVARPTDDGTLTDVEVSWKAQPHLDGSRSSWFQTQPLPAGRYRLRLRTEATVFYDQELALDPADPGSQPILFVDVPPPQNPPSSDR